MKGRTALAKNFIGIFSLIFTAVFLIFSPVASSSAVSGLSLCATKLIPTLFPLTVLSLTLMKSGLADKLSSFAEPFFRRAFRISGKSVLPVFIGIFCSAPAGASALKSIGGEMGDDERSSALLMSSSVSLGFNVGFVGQLLGAARRGLAVFAFQLISLVIAAFILRPKEMPASFAVTKKREAYSPFSIVSEAITEAAQSLLIICGSVVFFSSLGGIFLSLPIGDALKCLISAFLEMTSGADVLASRFDGNTAFVFISSAIGWSGLSMVFQVISCAGHGVPMGKYICGRVLAALLCPVLALFALRLGII